MGRNDVTWINWSSFRSTRMKFDSDYYIDNIVYKIVKPAFNDNVVHRNLFRQLNLDCSSKWWKMSQVTQINSLVRWKHSFLHSPKRLAPTFPDLSAIENIWRILSNNVYRDHEPKTLAYLLRHLQKSLKNVPQAPQALANDIIKFQPRKLC